MMWMVRNPEGKHAQELLEKGNVGIGGREAVPYLKGAKSPPIFMKPCERRILIFAAKRSSTQVANYSNSFAK